LDQWSSRNFIGEDLIHQWREKISLTSFNKSKNENTLQISTTASPSDVITSSRSEELASSIDYTYWDTIDNHDTCYLLKTLCDHHNVVDDVRILCYRLYHLYVKHWVDKQPEVLEAIRDSLVIVLLAGKLLAETYKTVKLKQLISTFLTKISVSNDYQSTTNNLSSTLNQYIQLPSPVKPEITENLEISIDDSKNVNDVIFKTLSDGVVCVEMELLLLIEFNPLHLCDSPISVRGESELLLRRLDTPSASFVPSVTMKLATAVGLLPHGTEIDKVRRRCTHPAYLNYPLCLFYTPAELAAALLIISSKNNKLFDKTDRQISSSTQSILRSIDKRIVGTLAQRLVTQYQTYTALAKKSGIKQVNSDKINFVSSITPTRISNGGKPVQNGHKILNSTHKSEKEDGEEDEEEDDNNRFGEMDRGSNLMIRNVDTFSNSSNRNYDRYNVKMVGEKRPVIMSARHDEYNNYQMNVDNKIPRKRSRSRSKDQNRYDYSRLRDNNFTLSSDGLRYEEDSYMRISDDGRYYNLNYQEDSNSRRFDDVRSDHPRYRDDPYSRGSIDIPSYRSRQRDDRNYHNNYW
jgi:hypothetical protein